MLMLVTSACGDDSDPPPPSSNEIFDSHSECETSDDHVWSVTISSVMDDVKISETHSFDFEPMACDSF